MARIPGPPRVAYDPPLTTPDPIQCLAPHRSGHAAVTLPAHAGSRNHSEASKPMDAPATRTFCIPVPDLIQQTGVPITHTDLRRCACFPALGGTIIHGFERER